MVNEWGEKRNASEARARLCKEWARCLHQFMRVGRVAYATIAMVVYLVVLHCVPQKNSNADLQFKNCNECNGFLLLLLAITV